MIETVGIVGVGLIGGSFGLALKQAGFKGTVFGVSSERSLAAAASIGAIDRGVTFEDAANTADLLFLSQPVEAIIATIRRLDPLVRADTLVTDAGSTKRAIAEAASESLKRCAFVGGHPMAGKEVRGAEAADANLFLERTWVLTGTSDSAKEMEFRRWLRRIGARELLLDAVGHDRAVAWSSHLPQLASTGLAAALHDLAPDSANVAGPGLLGATRLAMSSYDLWREILHTNADEVDLALSAYIERLQQIRSGLAKPDLAREFEKGAAFARKLRPA